MSGGIGGGGDKPKDDNCWRGGGEGVRKKLHKRCTADIFIHFRPFSSTFFHFHPLSSTLNHFYPFHPFSSTHIHFHPLSFMKMISKPVFKGILDLFWPNFPANWKPLCRHTETGQPTLNFGFKDQNVKHPTNDLVILCMVNSQFCFFQQVLPAVDHQEQGEESLQTWISLFCFLLLCPFTEQQTIRE